MKLTSILLLAILAVFRDNFVNCGESSVEDQPQIELATQNDVPSHFFGREIENRDLSHYHGHHGHRHGSYPYPPYRGKVVYIAKLKPNTNDDHVEVIRVPPHQSYPPPKSKGKGKGKGGYGKGKSKGGYGKGKGKGKGGYGKGKGKGGYGKGGKGGYAGYGW